MHRIFKPKRAALALILLAALGAVPASATVREVQANLSTSQAMVGEAVQLHVQVASDKKEDLPWPKVEGLEAFSVVKNISTSSNSSISVINGSV